MVLRLDDVSFHKTCVMCLHKKFSSTFWLYEITRVWEDKAAVFLRLSSILVIFGNKRKMCVMEKGIKGEGREGRGILSSIV